MGTTSSENDEGKATIADKPITGNGKEPIPQSLATSAEDVADDVPKTTLQPQTSSEDAPKVPDDAFCWICHEDGTKEWPGDQPGFQELKRDCSCRGSSGYAHWSCLVEYAVKKCSDGGDITK